MPSAVGESLRRLIEKSGKSQKAIAIEAHELTGGKNGKSDTFEQKLSKLLNGDAEGARFFLDDDDRREALRRAIGVAEAAWSTALRAPAFLAFALDAPARRFLTGTGRSEGVARRGPGLRRHLAAAAPRGSGSAGGPRGPGGAASPH